MPSTSETKYFQHDEEFSMRPTEFVKFVSPKGNQLKYQDEEKQKRIFTWMEQSDGATKQANV
jgi:hypothetical protein